MTERKAPAPDDSAAIQRTADRLIRQVGDLLLKHGELLAWTIHEPPGSDWVGAPTEHRIGKWFHFGLHGNGRYYVWQDSIDLESNPVRLFDSICHSLTGLLLRQSARLPDELAEWLRGDPGDAMARWVWFVAGFATTSLPMRKPRTRRKCWGSDGVSFFDADRLELQRSSLPEIWRERMPPNADCWLVEIKNLIQTTIDTVEYLAELPSVENSNNGTATSGGEANATDEQPEVITAPAVVAVTTNGEAPKKPGGRPRKTKLDPDESKVMRYRTANPKAAFCDIDDELKLERGESQRIYEAVTRRQRRKKSESADKTGQN